MTTLLAASRIAAASSGVALRTDLASCAPAADACTCPKAPKSTLVNDRFIAFDIMIERIRPEDPSSAPAMIRSLESSTNPMAAAEEHTSELQSPVHLVCRLLLEKKKID